MATRSAAKSVAVSKKEVSPEASSEPKKGFFGNLFGKLFGRKKTSAPAPAPKQEPPFASEERKGPYEIEEPVLTAPVESTPETRKEEEKKLAEEKQDGSEAKSGDKKDVPEQKAEETVAVNPPDSPKDGIVSLGKRKVSELAAKIGESSNEVKKTVVDIPSGRVAALAAQALEKKEVVEKKPVQIVPPGKVAALAAQAKESMEEKKVEKKPVEKIGGAKVAGLAAGMAAGGFPMPGMSRPASKTIAHVPRSGSDNTVPPVIAPMVPKQLKEGEENDRESSKSKSKSKSVSRKPGIYGDIDELPFELPESESPKSLKSVEEIQLERAQLKVNRRKPTVHRFSVRMSFDIDQVITEKKKLEAEDAAAKAAAAKLEEETAAAANLEEEKAAVAKLEEEKVAAAKAAAVKLEEEEATAAKLEEENAVAAAAAKLESEKPAETAKIEAERALEVSKKEGDSNLITKLGEENADGTVLPTEEPIDSIGGDFKIAVNDQIITRGTTGVSESYVTSTDSHKTNSESVDVKDSQVLPAEGPSGDKIKQSKDSVDDVVENKDTATKESVDDTQEDTPMPAPTGSELNASPGSDTSSQKKLDENDSKEPSQLVEKSLVTNDSTKLQSSELAKEFNFDVSRQDAQPTATPAVVESESKNSDETVAPESGKLVISQALSFETPQSPSADPASSQEETESRRPPEGAKDMNEFKDSTKAEVHAESATALEESSKAEEEEQVHQKEPVDSSGTESLKTVEIALANDAAEAKSPGSEAAAPAP